MEEKGTADSCLKNQLNENTTKQNTNTGGTLNVILVKLNLVYQWNFLTDMPNKQVETKTSRSNS